MPRPEHMYTEPVYHGLPIPFHEQFCAQHKSARIVAPRLIQHRPRHALYLTEQVSCIQSFSSQGVGSCDFVVLEVDIKFIEEGRAYLRRRAEFSSGLSWPYVTAESLNHVILMRSFSQHRRVSTSVLYLSFGQRVPPVSTVVWTVRTKCSPLYGCVWLRKTLRNVQ